MLAHFPVSRHYYLYNSWTLFGKKKKIFVLWGVGWGFCHLLNGYFHLLLTVVITVLQFIGEVWLAFSVYIHYSLFWEALNFLHFRGSLEPLLKYINKQEPTSKNGTSHSRSEYSYPGKIRASKIFMVVSFLSSNSVAKWGDMISGWKSLEKHSLLELWAYIQLCWLHWELIALEWSSTVDLFSRTLPSGWVLVLWAS